MRLILTIAACCIAASTMAATARPLDVHVRGGYRHARPSRIASYLVRHGLLTPMQAACASLVPGRHGSRRVAHISVFERSGGRCPGERQPPTLLFDVYVDTVSGVVDATPESPTELDTVL